MAFPPLLVMQVCHLYSAARTFFVQRKRHLAGIHNTTSYGRNQQLLTTNEYMLFEWTFPNSMHGVIKHQQAIKRTQGIH
jgi:hypothetical protein